MPPSNMDFRQSGKLATCSFLGFLLRFLFWKTKISMENNQKSSLVLETTYQVFEIQLNLHDFFFTEKNWDFRSHFVVAQNVLPRLGKRIIVVFNTRVAVQHSLVELGVYTVYIRFWYPGAHALLVGYQCPEVWEFSPGYSLTRSPRASKRFQGPWRKGWTRQGRWYVFCSVRIGWILKEELEHQLENCNHNMVSLLRVAVLTLRF